MRRFRGIVQNNIEPQDKEVLWLFKGIVYYYNNGWQPLQVSSDDILYFPDSEDSSDKGAIKVGTALDLLFKLGLITKENEKKINILNSDATTEGSVDFKIDKATIKNVEVSIENNVGTPSGTANFKDNTLSLQIHGVKGEKGEKGDQGPQGNSGYQGTAGELEVVNDLTTGGADKALSAEMGKELAKELTELESELQNSLYEITPKAFTESEKDALEAQGLWEAELNKYPLVYVLEN